MSYIYRQQQAFEEVLKELLFLGGGNGFYPLEDVRMVSSEVVTMLSLCLALVTQSWHGIPLKFDLKCPQPTVTPDSVF